MLANYFHVSLNVVLWSFRIPTVVVPIIVGLVTYGICLEMQGVQGIGKRKRAVIVHRSAAGEYSTVTAAPRPDDERAELEPEPVPERIDVAPLTPAGTRSQRRELADGLPPGHALKRTTLDPGRISARALWVVAESVHAVTYFAPAALAAAARCRVEGILGRLLRRPGGTAGCGRGGPGGRGVLQLRPGHGAARGSVVLDRRRSRPP